MFSFRQSLPFIEYITVTALIPNSDIKADPELVKQNELLLVYQTIALLWKFSIAFIGSHL